VEQAFGEVEKGGELLEGDIATSDSLCQRRKPQLLSIVAATGIILIIPKS
jgi:hypothetical protein